MNHDTRGWWKGVVAAAVVVAGAACGESPSTFTSPSPVLVRGTAPQGGVPTPNVSLPPVSAIGATRFVAFGDSITCGVPSSFDADLIFLATCDGYPAALDGILESTYALQDFTVQNLGEPGEWAVNAVGNGRFAQAMSTYRPQGLLLLEGINDLNNGRSISATVAALQQMVELARVYNVTVLISTMFQTCQSVSPQGVVRPNSATLIPAFNSAIRAMAAGRQNVYVVNLDSAFGNNCGPDGGINLLGADGLHPSPSGYSVMSSVFATAIRDRFAVGGSFQ